MSSHALLSPSSSHRWLNCTKCISLESEIEITGTTSTAAEEGSVAHALGEHKIKVALQRESKRPKSDYINEEMEEYTDDYASYVLYQYSFMKETCKDAVILIESRIDFSRYVKDGFGTADCIIVADDTLHIIDFKYGRGVLVDAYDNPQMKIYALGALEAYDSLYDVANVEMTIFQPRRENISNFIMLADELKTWAEEELKPKAELALSGKGDYKTGEWCQFCKGKVKCRARAEENLKIAQQEFAIPPTLSDDEISDILLKLPDITKWAKDIENYALDSAVNHGKKWRGFKLVESQVRRKYSDEKEVAKTLEENGYKDIYKKDLLPITKLEKLVGKKEFEKTVGGLIIRPKGKPILVPVTDKRKEINIVENEFKQEA